MAGAITQLQQITGGSNFNEGLLGRLQRPVPALPGTVTPVKRPRRLLYRCHLHPPSRRNSGASEPSSQGGWANPKQPDCSQTLTMHPFILATARHPGRCPMCFGWVADVPQAERHAGQDDELLEPTAICVWGGSACVDSRSEPRTAVDRRLPFVNSESARPEAVGLLVVLRNPRADASRHGDRQVWQSRGSVVPRSRWRS